MSSWGTGSSTSEQEARAAAISGARASDLPVNFSLPPSMQAAWIGSATRPGVSLIGADLRPSTMVENVRATIFPHIQQQVQATVASSMIRQAWSDVERFERLHAWRCGDVKPRLRMVQIVDDAGHERRSAAATTAASGTDTLAAVPAHNAQVTADAPPITAMENLFGKIWSGSFLPRSSVGTDGGVATPKRFLSTERWVVARCDGDQTYRVQYYGVGNHFYAQVVPTNLSGLAATAYLRFTQLFTPPS